MPKSEERPPGLYWHCYPDRLIEFCCDSQEHTYFIYTSVDASQIPTRLCLFQPVRGTLPKAVVQAARAYHQAWQTYDRTWKAYYREREVHNHRALETNDQAQAYDRALQAYDQADQIYHRAQQALNQAVKDNMPAIEALHKQECLNCPWDGTTIFPRA